MSLEELREAVMARADVDGMVEVPIGPGPESGGLPFELTLFSLLWAPPLVALFLAVTGAMLIAVMAAPALIREPATGLVLGAAILVLSYALVGIAYLRQRWRRRPARASPGRVLVLAPDGFVIGTRQGVLTFSWSDAELGTRRTPRGGWALAVAERGAIVAEVEAEWLEAPLSLVVAVAKAYRERIAPG